MFNSELEERMCKGKNILSYLLKLRIVEDSLQHLPIKFIRNTITKFCKFYVELKIANLLQSYDIERILYDFAECMHAFRLTDTDLAKLRIVNNDYDVEDYGIAFKVFTDSKDISITGINLKIWTKDKMAKLILQLEVNQGIFRLDIQWAYKNDAGVYVNYSRTNDILVARDEIKSILIEYILKHVHYIIHVGHKSKRERISPT